MNIILKIKDVYGEPSINLDLKSMMRDPESTLGNKPDEVVFTAAYEIISQLRASLTPPTQEKTEK